MILSYWTLFVALSLSLVAAWYSIAGLTAIFAAAAVPIIIMGAIMEVAKITVTVWLHEYWAYAKRSLKAQLTVSVVLLMFITSMGIFGYLSKAHSDQALVSGDVGAKVALYDEKIKIERDNIENARAVIKQLDDAVNGINAKGSDREIKLRDGSTYTRSAAEQALQVRRSQAKDRDRLTKEIEQAQARIVKLQEEAAPIRAEVRKVEAEVGPIKYIAALIYGDNPDANLLERAVRWVIIILVVVFDPLAIAMVLSATESLKWEKERKFEVPVEPNTPNFLSRIRDRFKKKQLVEPIEEDQHTHIPVETYYAPSVPPTSLVEQKELAKDPMIRVRSDMEDLSERLKVEPAVELDMFNDERLVSKFDKETGFVSPNAPGLDVSNERPGDYLTDADREKEAKNRWKAEHPDDTLKHQRTLLDQGVIDQLPWEKDLALAPDSAPIGNMVGFGIAFPSTPAKGDMFLRVDRIPSALYKYNGKRWIEVDKTLSDQYAYDDAYIDHLISKIESGEYDPELLSSAEQDQIEQRLNRT